MPDIYAIGLVIVLALAFDFINGFHDTANAIATCIATRSLSPRIAIIMSAFLNFVGAMVSTGVAKTIGGEIVTSPQMVDSTVLIAALFAAIVWNLFTWKIGMPSSSSHALIGGVLGAVTISYGTGAINGNGVFMIVAGLIGSPIIAMFSGYVIMTLLFILFRNVGRSKVNYISLHIQSLSAAVMAFSHGSNDAQKCMGIITLALLSGGYIGELEVPFLVKIACAFAMCAGTSVGGWRIIRTVGNKIFRLEPVNGLAADINSALTIFTATFLHLPVSTTHVVTGSIMGVGWAKRFRAVHWNVAYSMVGAWVMTIPSTAAVGALVYILIRYIF
ncbi:MAG: inorganic phosphate transporter [Dialister sp.]|jgi:PiT family inorganic phosphate transporter|uniref:inorganic phosphate transporter n=1 Tax=Dialister TaxID=39948 RepID=UPI0023EF82A0|nr:MULTISPECIES: inorganic phosphate transporter [Dialister]MBS6294838.1 inorganic phosphate transporter [Dialister sp.]